MKTDEASSNLKNVEKKRFKPNSNEVIRILNYIATENIISTSRLLKAAGCVVTRKLK